MLLQLLGPYFEPRLRVLARSADPLAAAIAKLDMETHAVAALAWGYWYFSYQKAYR